MPQFLIEVPHPEEALACARIVKVFLSTGSHFLTHADLLQGFVSTKTRFSSYYRVLSG